MALTWKVSIIRQVMYLTTFIIGLGLFGISIMYLVKGRSVEATYFIVAFLIAETLAISFKYCDCCYYGCYGGMPGQDEDFIESQYSVFVQEETSEQKRIKQEIYNNEPYSALIPKSDRFTNEPKLPSYGAVVPSTNESPVRLSPSGIIRDRLDSSSCSDSYRIDDRFPVLNPGSPPFVDVEPETIFHHSVDNYFEVDHPEHKSISRYNSFQSNSLPADLRTTDLEISFRSYDTVLSTGIVSPTGSS